MPQHVVLRQNLCIELFYLVFVPHNAGTYFDTHLYIRKVEVLVTQSCPALCDPMDCSLPGSSVHGFLQARILEWVAIHSPGDLPSPRELPDPEIELASPTSPALARRIFITESPGMSILTLLSYITHLLAKLSSYTYVVYFFL